ncbi:leucyl aminopeptidase family protein [Phanerochaete sordida]|uniref:Leucyl aminopeptidase family protein n=1 Tax=Phanerochaete sordida TaxID=48140 RepID=A0A9P3G7U7_9APHY|nr:leucyl aminopeptidase family protein [Phanerochaete sordida]
MSSIFVVPVDPSSPKASVDGVDAEKLWSSLPHGTKPPKAGSTSVFFGTPASGAQNITALTSLGPSFSKQSTAEDAKRELVRTAVGSAVQQIKGLGEGVNGREVAVDVSAAGDAHAAAVAAHLALYGFNLKTEPASAFDPRNEKLPPPRLAFAPIPANADKKAWTEGVVYAEAQNLARTLMELPANMLTPTLFCERVKKEFDGVDGVEIIVRDAEWAAKKGMNSFISVTRGTSQPAKFLEIHYRGAVDKNATPLVFVGKGITFDSGGISIKPSADMKLMRGDMGGAATVVSSALAIAKLRLPINLTVVTPLTENMPGPSATKPGDIVYAMNGKSIEVDNTDAEGRLVLADALYYACTEFKPTTVVDVATLTGAMDIALGEVFTGVFTNSDGLWAELDAAGAREHDRFWRMPLAEDYGAQIEGSNADLCNTGGRPAGACTAALFLRAFVPGLAGAGEEGGAVRWAHVDMAGTMEATRRGAYQERGMTGRPTRALVEFARRAAQ